MILVDALNLINAAPRLRELQRERGLGAAERELIRVCARYARRAACTEIVLVFDGNRPRGEPMKPPRGLLTRYVPDADADLLELLARRGDHLLVSADGELVARAVRSEHPAAWFQSLEDVLAAGDEEALKTRQPNATEVNDWLELFGEAPPKPAGQTPETASGLAPDQVQDWLEYFGEA